MLHHKTEIIVGFSSDRNPHLEQSGHTRESGTGGISPDMIWSKPVTENSVNEHY